MAGWPFDYRTGRTVRAVRIVTECLSKAFGNNQVLREVSLTFETGSRTCLTGPSGCGKTTFLYLLMGLIKPDSGRVLLPERCRMSVVFQENRLLEHRSALSNLRLVCRGIPEAMLKEALIQVGLEENVHMIPARELSGGMARRVAIVRAMLAPSDVILMDEPLKGLDAENRKRTIDFINSHLEQKTLIIVTHDTRDPADFSADIVRLESL